MPRHREPKDSILNDELDDRKLRSLAEVLAARLAGAERKGLSIAAFGARWGYSERTVWTFVERGLPTVMAGRLRRVDVDAADDWIRQQRLREDDIETAARADARSRGRGD